MPVVSKPVRSRNAPPLVGPRPYKNPREAWSSSTDSGSVQVMGTPEINGNASAQASPTRPKGSILKSPSGEGPASSAKATVTFSNENICSDPPIPPRRLILRKPQRKEIRHEAAGNISQCRPADKVSPTVTSAKCLSLTETVQACEVRKHKTFTMYN